MAVRVNAGNFAAETLESDKLVIADFYSDSCVPCKRISPLLAEAEEQYGNVKIVKINVNFDMDLAEKYEVTAAPTLVFFKDGQERARLRGAVKKSEIISAIKSIEGGELL